MADFLKDELSGLPPTVSAAILAELEAVVRAARFSSLEGGADYSLQCQRLCARITSSLQLALRIKEVIARQARQE